MAREDILNYLEEEYEKDAQRWHTIKELRQVVSINQACLAKNLQRMRKCGEVAYKTHPLFPNGRTQWVYRKSQGRTTRSH